MWIVICAIISLLVIAILFMVKCMDELEEKCHQLEGENKALTIERNQERSWHQAVSKEHYRLSDFIRNYFGIEEVEKRDPRFKHLNKEAKKRRKKRELASIKQIQL